MSALADTIAATLAEHWVNGSRCDCGWRPDYSAPTWWVEQHAAHVADILAADFTARLNAERARNGQAPPEGWLS